MERHSYGGDGVPQEVRVAQGGAAYFNSRLLERQ
jgi:hypothetical protein